MNLIKTLKLFIFFLLGIMGQENVFDEILERKQAFLDYKKKRLEQIDKLGFFKVISPWFLVKKLKNFRLFLLGIIG